MSLSTSCLLACLLHCLHLCSTYVLPTTTTSTYAQPFYGAFTVHSVGIQCEDVMLTACALLDFQHDRLSHSESSVSEHVRRSRLKAVEHVYTTKLETRSSWTRGRRMTLHSLKRHHPVGLSHQSSGAATADELQDIKVRKGGGSNCLRRQAQGERLAVQAQGASAAQAEARGAGEICTAHRGRPSH